MVPPPRFDFMGHVSAVERISLNEGTFPPKEKNSYVDMALSSSQQ